MGILLHVLAILEGPYGILRTYLTYYLNLKTQDQKLACLLPKTDSPRTALEPVWESKGDLNILNCK